MPKTENPLANTKHFVPKIFFYVEKHPENGKQHTRITRAIFQEFEVMPQNSMPCGVCVGGPDPGGTPWEQGSLQKGIQIETIGIDSGGPL